MDPGPQESVNPDVKRFQSYIEKQTDTDCWIWKGGKDIKSYGIFFYKGSPRFAHRVSLILFGRIKSLTPGLHVLHSCRNKDCVNPDHLREGTATENAADKKRDKTDLSGSRCHFAKLTWDIISIIRKKASDGTKTKQLASEFNVSLTTIRSIINNKTWVQ